MFSKILVANRGEIAIRVIRSCKEMGISTVSVFSEADRDSMHTVLADQSICIGGAAASDSYLNVERVVSAALAAGAQAIHPGYGFLSESAALAELCEKHNIAFIGPPSGIIAKMGDKEEARRIMREAGVPVIPGSDTVKSPREAAAAAEKIGYPLMIKARSGGGGKGIRRVDSPEELEKAFLTAAYEAEKAFGDGALYLEKRIHPSKHVEIQILADEYGNTVCFAERDCTVQKHNQKLLEESPSAAVDGKLRKKLMDAALKAAKAVGYVNTGTVEFLLDADKNFYFMEMNVRLQVEHAVTEQVSDVDLVKWQIRVAAGVPLDFTQKDIRVTGSSIECRINASSVGKVEFLHVPGGPHVRFDSALWMGYTIPPYYDSLMGKLIVCAATREEAIRKMHAALCELVIDGVPNNIDEQIGFVSDDRFRRGEYYSDFLAKSGDN